MDKISQCKRILRHLNEVGSITPGEAINEYGVMRLAARIADLRKAGVQIGRTMEPKNNRYGERVYVAKYFLEDNT